MVGQGGLPHTRFSNQSGIQRDIVFSDDHPGRQNLGHKLFLSYPFHGNIVGLTQLDLYALYGDFFHSFNCLRNCLG